VLGAGITALATQTGSTARIQLKALMMKALSHAVLSIIVRFRLRPVCVGRRDRFLNSVCVPSALGAGLWAHSTFTASAVSAGRKCGKPLMINALRSVGRPKSFSIL
jgi:hypothetical protein